MKTSISTAFSAHGQNTILIRGQQGSISFQTFLQHVSSAARRLPEHRFAINVCEDRYSFMVGMMAAIVRGQTNLLPPNRLNHTITALGESRDDCYCLSDRHTSITEIAQHILTIETESTLADDLPEIDPEHIAVIAFTSGSTAEPTPNAKSWRNLVTGARIAQHRFCAGSDHTLVATVPAQHMYGLETTVFLPIVCGLGVHSGKPFFPEDIRQTLAAVPSRRILITSPTHLRVCVESELNWPEVDFIISATAPLPGELAATAEEVFDTRVFEIYGCTEAGSIASRRTVDGNQWTLYDGYSLQQRGTNYFVDADHIDGPVRLGDNLELLQGGCFKLLGRHGDQINIAGKRASLVELNRELIALEGVRDGVFIMPEESGGGTDRLAALFVSDELDESQVLALLATRMDAAFLPRPLRRVSTLPRNETGKLPRSLLLALLNNPDPGPEARILEQ